MRKHLFFFKLIQLNLEFYPKKEDNAILVGFYVD